MASVHRAEWTTNPRTRLRTKRRILSLDRCGNRCDLRGGSRGIGAGCQEATGTRGLESGRENGQVVGPVHVPAVRRPEQIPAVGDHVGLERPVSMSERDRGATGRSEVSCRRNWLISRKILRRGSPCHRWRSKRRLSAHSTPEQGLQSAPHHSERGSRPQREDHECSRPR